MQQNARPLDSRTAETRQRLIDESLRLFAEHGFKGVSVRDIAAAAQANVAAVSYHFGSKQGLYRTIFETVLDEDEGRFREQIGNVEMLLGRAGSDPALLAAAADILVSGVVGRLSRFERLRWFSVLVARELAFPGELFDLLYRRRTEPALAVFSRILGAAWGAPADSPAGSAERQHRLRPGGEPGLCPPHPVAPARLGRVSPPSAWICSPAPSPT